MEAGGGLDRLYREIVLDHSSHPRNAGRMTAPDREATGHNPLCGDKVTLFLRLAGDGRIGAVTFEGTGCAISLASASMLTERVRGLDEAGAREVIHCVEGMFADTPGPDAPGDLAALAGVREYPARVRCATLPWRTLDAALRRQPSAVTTEELT